MWAALAPIPELMMSDQKCTVTIISGIAGATAGALSGLAVGQAVNGMAIGGAVSIAAGIVGALLYKSGSGKPRVAVSVIPHAGWIGGLAASMHLHGGLVGAFVGCIIGYVVGVLIPAFIVAMAANQSDLTNRKPYNTQKQPDKRNKTSDIWIYFAASAILITQIPSKTFSIKKNAEPQLLRKTEIEPKIEEQSYHNLAQSQAAAILASGKPFTVRQIAMLAGIINGQNVSINTTVDSSTLDRTGTTRLSTPPIDTGTVANMPDNGLTPNNMYRGSMGTAYQYDLSDPIQRVRYGVDPMAQLRDSISVDPRRQLDQSMGQYGGGIRREP